MRIAIVLLLLLPGCALYEAQTGADRFDVASREPVCARQCLGAHGQCVQGAAGTGSTGITVINACNGTTRQCLATCPPK